MGRSRRRRVDLFAGARGKAKSPEYLDGWIIQKKHDGQYVEFDLDCRGKIEEIRSKTGRPVRTEEAQSMLGVVAGFPLSTLCGELTGHTEQGKRDARNRGYSRIHIFDALVLDDQIVHEEPYHHRLDRIHRMHAELATVAGRDMPWTEDEKLRARDFHGRFTKRVPRSWRRTPIVESYYTQQQAKKLWQEYVIRDKGEGIVFCDPNAPVAKRGCKLKKKPFSTLDADVIEVGPRYARCRYLDISELEHGVQINECQAIEFIVGCSSRYLDLSPGDKVEIGFERLHEQTKEPIHAYIVRPREDLLC